MIASCVKVSTCKMLGTVAGLHTYLFNLHHNIYPGGLMQCPPDQNLNLNVTTCLMHMLHFLWCTLCISPHNLLFSFNLLPDISNYSITPNHTINTAHNALHHTVHWTFFAVHFISLSEHHKDALSGLLSLSHLPNFKGQCPLSNFFLG